MNNNFLGAMQSFIKMGNNPQMIAQNLIKQNPQFNALYNQMMSSGMSCKDFVIQYCKQQNIDIKQVEQIAQNLGIKI